MTIASAIVAGVTATKDIAEAIQTVAGILDTPRSIVLTLENKTKFVLEKVSDSHEHGGFGVTPVHILEQQQAEVFGSRDTGVFTGNKGQVTYRMRNHSPETYVLLTWGNPFIGANTAGGLAHTVQTVPMPPGLPPMQLPIPSQEFYVIVTCGGGDKDVQMRYTLMPK
jgi:hypothetical protein